jgi:RNA 2',3'-cyclic 3'-phosphodiesterase
MPRTTRTFVAIAVPELLGAKLTRLQRLLAPEIPGARWSETSPFHMTLAFLGDVADVDLKPVCEAVAVAAADFEPFELRLEGLGVFPAPAKARVAWVGLAGPGLPALAELRDRVARAATSTLSLPVDARFSPHITLGRLKVDRRNPLDLSPLLKHYRTWSAGSFHVTEVITFASTLTPDGPVYARLGTAPLREGPDRAASPLPSVDPAEEQT